jgi:DNA-binding HxlR family transcriptional regulator
MTGIGKGELGAEHAQRLPAELRGAMGHPYRRQILRRLDDGDGERSTAELRECGCIPCTLPCLTYHLGVLVEAGLVRRIPTGSVEGRIVHLFAAADHGQAVAEILQTTAALDGRHLELTRA